MKLSVGMMGVNVGRGGGVRDVAQGGGVARGQFFKLTDVR